MTHRPWFHSLPSLFQVQELRSRRPPRMKKKNPSQTTNIYLFAGPCGHWLVSEDLAEDRAVLRSSTPCCRRGGSSDAASSDVGPFEENIVLNKAASAIVSTTSSKGKKKKANKRGGGKDQSKSSSALGDEARSGAALPSAGPPLIRSCDRGPLPVRLDFSRGACVTPPEACPDTTVLSGLPDEDLVEEVFPPVLLSGQHTTGQIVFRPPAEAISFEELIKVGLDPREYFGEAGYDEVLMPHDVADWT